MYSAFITKLAKHWLSLKLIMNNFIMLDSCCIEVFSRSGRF